MRFKYNDGGRAEAGFKGTTGDCVCRAIAIAAERPYKEVYDLINKYAKDERTGSRKRGKSNARTGVYRSTEKKVFEHYGFQWVPTMQIGKGCTTHLRDGELPNGRIVAQVTRHLTAVIDGEINDTYDPSRGGTRCVYGYWCKAPDQKYLVVYDFMAPSGKWFRDCFDNKGKGFSKDEADNLVEELSLKTDSIRRVRRAVMTK